MEKQKFTQEQIALLKENPYTKSVTPSQIRFTDQFKNEFWQACLDGQSPEQIFKDKGYDTELIGHKRIQNTYYLITRDQTSRISQDPAKEIADLRNEVRKLSFELNALKKKHHAGQLKEVNKLMSGDPSSIFPLIQELSSQPENTWSKSEWCEIFGVSRSGYYAWLAAAEKREAREQQDRADFELILKVYKQRGFSKGVRSIHMGLLRLDPPVRMNQKKIRRLMRKYKLICPIRKANPYRRMAKSLKTNNTAENLVNREFEEHGPRKVLLTDITYIPYASTFAYLSTILDAFTKQVLAYVVNDNLQVDFVLETVNQLVKEHGESLTE